MRTWQQHPGLDGGTPSSSTRATFSAPTSSSVVPAQCPSLKNASSAGCYNKQFRFDFGWCARGDHLQSIHPSIHSSSHPYNQLYIHPSINPWLEISPLWDWYSTISSYFILTIHPSVFYHCTESWTYEVWGHTQEKLPVHRRANAGRQTPSCAHTDVCRQF